jgi:hypothetical protein
MVKLIEWFGVGWGVLTALSIGFVVLLAWRTHPRAAASQSAVLRSAVPQAAVPQAAVPQSAVSQSSVPPPGAVKPAATAPLHGDLRPLTFEARELDLGAEVAGALAQFRDIAQRHHVELQITAQPRLAVWADPGALRQMLARMLTQAVERTPGTAVLLSAGWHGGRVQVTVTDDGPAGDHAALVGRLREVEQFAALQGGTLEIECWKLRGNRVVLRMPGKAAPDTLATDDDVPDGPAVARGTPWTGVVGAA